MKEDMRKDAEQIIKKTIQDVMPDKAVLDCLKKLDIPGSVRIIAIGKAAWVMAQAAAEYLKGKIEKGLIVTKYGHAKGALEGFEIVEAAHPTPDENSVKGAKKAFEMVREAGADTTVLFLLSGGGSSLVELPMPGLTLADIQKVTKQLLFCGACITEINVLRKKLSAVKGGKLAAGLSGQKAYSIILSDILGDNPDMIASGITYEDSSTAQDVRKIIDKYNLKLDNKVKEILFNSKPCENIHVENFVVGSVEELCRAAAGHAGELGYAPHIVNTAMECEAGEAGKWITSLYDGNFKRPYAIVAGGETVVKVRGKGMGGRNQELALTAALALKGKEDVLLFSLGSDGTDGPTDAAGGIVDGDTADKILEAGADPEKMLTENDSYHALKLADGLIITGATGTNVNDVTVMLCK